MNVNLQHLKDKSKKVRSKNRFSRVEFPKRNSYSCMSEKTEKGIEPNQAFLYSSAHPSERYAKEEIAEQSEIFHMRENSVSEKIHHLFDAYMTLNRRPKNCQTARQDLFKNNEITELPLERSSEKKHNLISERNGIQENSLNTSITAKSMMSLNQKKMERISKTKDAIYNDFCESLCFSTLRKPKEYQSLLSSQNYRKIAFTDRKNNEEPEFEINESAFTPFEKEKHGEVFDINLEISELQSQIQQAQILSINNTTTSSTDTTRKNCSQNSRIEGSYSEMKEFSHKLKNHTHTPTSTNPPQHLSLFKNESQQSLTKHQIGSAIETDSGIAQLQRNQKIEHKDMSNTKKTNYISRNGNSSLENEQKYEYENQNANQDYDANNVQRQIDQNVFQYLTFQQNQCASELNEKCEAHQLVLCNSESNPQDDEISFLRLLSFQDFLLNRIKRQKFMSFKKWYYNTVNNQPVLLVIRPILRMLLVNLSNRKTQAFYSLAVQKWKTCIRHGKTEEIEIVEEEEEDNNKENKMENGKNGKNFKNLLELEKKMALSQHIVEKFQNSISRLNRNLNMLQEKKIQMKI